MFKLKPELEQMKSQIYIFFGWIILLVFVRIGSSVTVSYFHSLRTLFLGSDAEARNNLSYWIILNILNETLLCFFLIYYQRKAQQKEEEY